MINATGALRILAVVILLIWVCGIIVGHLGGRILIGVSTIAIAGFCAWLWGFDE